METLRSAVEVLNALTPLGLAGGLAYIIYHLIAKKGRVRTISDNHLSGLPALENTVQKILESAGRQEETLGEIRDGINFLRGRANGRT